jgi:predicted phage tail protein
MLQSQTATCSAEHSIDAVLPSPQGAEQAFSGGTSRGVVAAASLSEAALAASEDICVLSAGVDGIGVGSAAGCSAGAAGMSVWLGSSLLQAASSTAALRLNAIANGVFMAILVP